MDTHAKDIILNVLRRHGVPIHYELVARIVRDSRTVSDDYVRKVLATSSDAIRISRGVYLAVRR